MDIQAAWTAAVEAAHRRPAMTLAATHAFAALVVLSIASEGQPLRALARGFKQVFGVALPRLLFRTVLSAVPSSVMDGENAKIRRGIEESVIGSTTEGEDAHTELPEIGVSEEELLRILASYSDKDAPRWANGRVSGGIYFGVDGESDGASSSSLMPSRAGLTRVQEAAVARNLLSNPLHPDLFPHTRKAEAEVVSMALRLFHGDPGPDGEGACGSMTSGGTESILVAMRAYRELARATRGVTEPELIVPTTAHAAFDKACDYFGIKLVHIPVNPATFRADPAAMRAAITRNTIALVASAPSFGQGVIDPIQDIAAIARERGLPLHVDCCLGSFLIACADEAGFPVPPFDFRVPGVTSISADTHKYGFAPKGSSVLMYSKAEYRRAQYFVAPGWTGGIYASPTIAGSRVGAMVVGAWATMMYFGKRGYVEAARTVLTAARRIAEGVRANSDLVLFGEPDLSVVCFGTKAGSSANIYHIADELKERHWNLNILQHPACIHICVTYANAPHADAFVADMNAAVATSLSTPKDKYKNGASAFYGMAASIPDPSMISTFAHMFLDTMYKA